MNMNFDSRQSWWGSSDEGHQSWWGSSDEGHLFLISGSAAIIG